jgi:hypothetical protein
MVLHSADDSEESLLPLFLIVGPALVTENFVTILVTTGMGGGAIGVALIGVLGGFAFSGFGPRWLRWVSGVVSAMFSFGLAYGLHFAAGGPGISPGVGDAFAALLVFILMVLLIAGVSAPSRYAAARAGRQPSSSPWLNRSGG